MVEEEPSELRFLDDLMALPTTVSTISGNRLLRESEYKRRTLSKATIQSLVGSNKSSIDRMLAYAFRASSIAQPEVPPILASTFGESGSEAEVLSNGKKTTPNAEDDIIQGRLFLEQKGSNNISVWSHLNDMLRKILSERPDNVIEYFEEYSRQVKQERFAEQSGFIRDVFMPPEQLEYSKKQLGLIEGYAVEDEVEDVAAGEEEEVRRAGKRKMDLMEAAYYFSQCGVHLPDSELFTVNVAMKNFVKERGVLNPRFWGKVYGSKSNYFIIECQLPEDEVAQRNEEEEAEETAIEEQLKTEQEEAFRDKEEAERIANEEEDNYWLQIEMEEAKAEEERLMKLEEERLLKEEEERVAAEQSPEEEHEKEELGEEEQQPTEGRGININDDKTSISKNEEFLNVTNASINEVSEKQEPAPPEEDPLLPPLPPPKKILTYKIPLTMKPPPKPEIKIPTEKYGEGVNKKVFFACTEPGEEWIELPKVTPKQIIAARQLKIYFTGNPNAKIDSYPEFPGTESGYLRAQIARISAGTQISPLGFYSFSEGGEEEEEEEAEEEEEEGDRNTYVENSSFEPIPIKDLVDPSLSFWVHHTQHILKQGRAIFWSTKKPPSGEEDEEEAEAEEEEDEKDKEEKEVGPPLLTPLSEDASLEAITPWTVRKSSNYNHACAIAFIRSNLWPGAYAFAAEKKFENIYIGNGHKYSSQGFSPTMLPHPEYEYLLGPEIMEINDPSVELEEEWRVAHKKKPPPKPEEEGEEEEAGEEEEEEDDE